MDVQQVTASIGDALAAHVAVVDREGTVVYVNRAWEQFALENGCDDLAVTGVGSNYYSVCERSGGESAPAQAGLALVLHGEREYFELEYRCDSPTEERWFLMQVTPLHSGGERLAVVVHHNVTFRRKQQAAEAEEEASESRKRERSQWERLGFAGAPAAQTSATFGLGALRNHAASWFEQSVALYGSLIERVIEDRIFGRARNVADELRQLADRIGASMGGPRDVIDIHQESVRRKISGVPAARAAAYQEESRLLLLELMGHLVSYYRSQSPSSGSMQGSPRKQNHG